MTMPGVRKIGYILGRIIAPLLIVALGVGSLIVFGQKPEKQETARAIERQPIVEVIDVRAFDETFFIEVEGVALPLRQVQTGAEVAGVVKSKVEECRGGQYVEAGQLLIEIDATDYLLDRDRLQAQLEQAEENLAEIGIDLENTAALIALAEEEAGLQRRSLQRIVDLQGRGASTDAALDDAKRLELASRHALRVLQNQRSSLLQRTKTLTVARKLAETQLKQAVTDIERARVVAPVAGTIVTTSVEEGDYVKVGDPLFRINDTNDMEVSCQLRVDELYWVWLQAGTFSGTADMVDAATFELPRAAVEVAFEFKGVEYVWSGELSRYDGTGLDPLTRTVPCRILVREPTEVRVAANGSRGLVAPPTLFSGMYVKVRIPIDPPIPLVQLPTMAVQPGGEVWLVRDGALDIEQVTIARTTPDAVLLLATTNGPRPGDQVVVSPLAGPSQGMAVEAIRPDSPLERVLSDSSLEDASPRDTSPAGAR